MTARYLRSDFQTYVRSVMEGTDWSVPNVFVTTPFLIDASGDRKGFDAVVDSDAQALLIQHQEQGDRPSGVWPRRQVAAYIGAQAKAHARMLDAHTLADVEVFIRRWISEEGRRPEQHSKAKLPSPPAAIEIVLPTRGFRLPVPLIGLP